MARHKKESEGNQLAKPSHRRSTKSKSSSTEPQAGAAESCGGSSHSSRTTTDHDEIRQWAEERGGTPACVKGTGDSEDTGIIRIEFAETSNSRDDQLQQISWEEFFEKFDNQGLALVYQEETSAGEKSNFNKLVKRDRAKAAHASSD